MKGVETWQGLIKGWALLDAVCDSSACKGSTPLMRDREEQVCGSLRWKSLALHVLLSESLLQNAVSL